jgi:hypothetical protein
MKQIWIALLLIASGGSANAQDKPNVVVILSDNVGYGTSARMAQARFAGCQPHASTSSPAKGCD